MKNRNIAIWITAGALLMALPAFSQGDRPSGQGRAVVTILPKQHGGTPPSITQKDLTIKVNGKPANVTSFEPLRGPGAKLELVLLIDSAARNSLGSQFSDIEHFVNSLPPNTRAAIAYMLNGRAFFVGGLTSNHAEVLKDLHLPAGSPGLSASPYFCLSDLAKNWPSMDHGARRVVVMVTDGVDNYEPRYDPEDPYVQAAIEDSVRAGLVVYPLYWLNQGRFSGTMYANNTGQSLLVQLADATGGKNLWDGIGNPVSFQPYLDDLNHQLENQYELHFTAALDGKPTVETLKLKAIGSGVNVTAPHMVYVNRAE